MKRFLRKRWHGIPIGIIASILIGTAVLATVVISVTQVITQEVVEEPVPPEPSIVAEGFALPSAYEYQAFTWEAIDPVLVSPVVDGRYLSLVLTADAGYTDLEVTLTCTDSPDPGAVPLDTVIVVNKTTPETDLLLGGAGTYTFSQKVTGTVGPAGSLTSTLVVAIEDADPGY